jgi:tRNA (guanosine-2'-O-)-methyltransferase
MIQSLSSEEKAGLYLYLKEYLTAERLKLIEDTSAQRTRHISFGLEDVYQEHNAGALVRTCECFGIQDLYVIENHHEFRASPNISRGSYKWINSIYFRRSEDPIQDCIANIKSKGYRLAATTPGRNSVPLEELNLETPTLFFFGKEKHGLDQQIIDAADVQTHIPMSGVTESLNVSVAAGVTAHHITSRLKSSDIPWQLSEEDLLDLRIEWTLHSIRSPKMLLRNYLRTHGHEV